MKLYDILGKEITVLVNEEQTAGDHRLEFDAAKYKLSSGVYLYKLKTEGGDLIKKMTYIK